MGHSLKVNGTFQQVDAPGDTPLLYVLRDLLELSGPKFGCGLGQCGACMVHVDGEPVLSCVTALDSVAGGDIVTLEGLGSPEAPHPVQSAFIDHQAMQCGYCANGMMMAAAALLAKNPDPTETQIRDALAANLCRCGTHTRIIRAVKQAAGKIAK